LSTAVGLTPGGSTHLHINNTQSITIGNKTTRITNKTTQITNLEECWPCPVFANYSLAFALQLRKKHGKTSVRVAEEIFATIKKNLDFEDMKVKVKVHNMAIRGQYILWQYVKQCAVK
jgi:arginyl-tRNA synthetase